MCLLVCSPCRAQTEEDFDWVGRHFPSALNELLPIEQEPDAYIGFRSHRDLHHNVFEYSFLLSKDYPANRVTAVVRMADSVTLYDQLMSLHRRNPAESYENLKGQLKIKEWRFTDAECPALEPLFERFSRTRFRPPSPELLVLHSMIYEIRTSASAGDMRLVFIERENALVAWALNIRRAAESCINSSWQRQNHHRNHPHHKF
jgi:hypothetical protein